MKTVKLEALLNRSLTASETTNLKTYLKIAQEQMDTLLCYFGGDDDIREFDPRVGYRTLFTEPFTEVTSVEVDGEVTTDYVAKHWNSRRGDWFNVIEFDEPMVDKIVTVEADWGFGECMPADLELLLSRLFNHVSTGSQVDGRVIEKDLDRSYRVKYSNTSGKELIDTEFASVIQKYSLCNVGEIRHGRSYGDWDYRDYGYLRTIW